MMSILKHCVTGLLIRGFFIVYGEIQDRVSLVPYTDVDYRVFTDAARHVVAGSSPYLRHTYRYSPVIAYLMVPNVLVHVVWGKIVLSLIDVGVGYLIYRLVLVKNDKSLSKNCAYFWLYNPLPIVITTRGNADSLSAALVLMTVLLLCKGRIVLAGMMHGLAIHLRLYPLVFSLPMYLALRSTDSKSYGLCPNCTQAKLVASCVSVVVALTAFFYFCYDFEFLQESFLYHLSRRDIRHNFSVYFYMLYLTAASPTPSLLFKILTFAPQGILQLVFSFVYGSKDKLMFCLLVQAIVMVTYNPVVTSQYFMWFLSLLPACAPALAVSKKQAIILGASWGLAQLLWLIPAYFLEFQGYDTFLLVWVQSLIFLCVNITILVELIKMYDDCKVC
ncbi:GPI mannosyltransferase 1 [Bacillus rossius redtenbacheri]|uniref:GPI mannosyltransferase 1 n=1 Tax=Bacillus rossius redtenbacheri TaxID=93214 RepID=UPI002FDD92EE